MTTPARNVHIRTRLGPILALVVGIAVVPLAIAAAIADHRGDVDSERRALSNEANQQAESLRDYFARARSLTQVAARNPSFEQFYELPGSRRANVLAQGPVVKEANEALSYLEELFPDSMREACFIDRGGAENARAVRGAIAPLSELSPDETQAPFFAPTFALRPGQVYQSRPYVSPDTHDWVIANSTPIRGSGGSKPAIVHFEITIESFRRNAAQSSERFDVAIVSARNARVVVDSRFPQREGEDSPLGRPADRRFAALVRTPEKEGSLELEGRQASFERLGRKGENANDWIVVAAARTPTGSWLSGFGALQAIMIAAALALLFFAVTSLRRSHRELRHAALRDPLTDLPNRRSLMADLERRSATASRAEPLLLTLFDLDGFKAYNDSFGHPAGDALLVRLGRSLEREMAPQGRTYRMGGDEFCVVTKARAAEVDEIESRASSALFEHGEGFTVTASCGSVLLPIETDLAAEALRKADQRMYARKSQGRASAGRQTTDVLLKVLSERNPDLGMHLDGVAELCAAVGRRLGLPQEEMAPLVQAASLHDVGKAAIPDAILARTGPLTDEEWQFIRRHTLIGERILGAAPALVQASRLVRWSHERFDGAGYPDGLHGDEIPLGARIIAVADAYDAMTSDRPYRMAMSPEGALAELRRCAGTQFDAAVVDEFCAAMADRRLAVGLLESPGG